MKLNFFIKAFITLLDSFNKLAIAFVVGGFIVSFIFFFSNKEFSISSELVKTTIPIKHIKTHEKYKVDYISEKDKGIEFNFKNLGWLYKFWFYYSEAIKALIFVYAFNKFVQIINYFKQPKLKDYFSLSIYKLIKNVIGGYLAFHVVSIFIEFTKILFINNLIVDTRYIKVFYIDLIYDIVIYFTYFVAFYMIAFIYKKGIDIQEENKLVI